MFQVLFLNSIIHVNLESHGQYSQEEILGFSTIQIHYVFSEMGQSSQICDLYGFSKK
jgi:hypothetical protein